MKFARALAAAVLVAVAPAQVQAASSYSPAQPPAAPLAVRSPYLSTWLYSGADGLVLPGVWPVFWSDSVNGWQGFVRVDGTTYNWMGNAAGPAKANQTSFTYTATRSIFTIQAGPVQLEVQFLSPIYPTDYVRQSLTSSYVSVNVHSTDGELHDVQIYADVTGEWASANKSSAIQWEQASQDGVLYHKFWLQNQTTLTEYDQQAEWGNWYWATGSKQGVTFQIGEDTVVRPQFASTGNLTDKVDTNYRAINDEWPVFAFSRDLGSVSGASVNTLFTVGYTQTEAILFQGNGTSPEQLAPTWTSSMQEQDVVSFVYHDYGHASSSSDTIDHKVESDSTKYGGSDYPTITMLAARQVFGALQFVGTGDNMLVFLKEISSDGDTNTVDVLFPTFPALLYFNHDLIKYTLLPLLIYQESGNYPNTYAVHDLGPYPQALGYPAGNDEMMPLEECGNMLIMMLAYTQKTNDNAFLDTYWNKVEQWAGYLVAEAKIPALQLSTDDFAGHLANQTNLAIKGIIALEAVSVMAERLGNQTARANYSSIAHNYLDFWEQQSIVTSADPPHTNLAYNENNTYGLLYNVFGDKVLKLDFIPQRIYDMQSNFYPTVFMEYGVILDTRNTWTKVDWEMLCASVASPSTRAKFIQTIATWIDQTTTNRAFTDLYNATTGGYPSPMFVARPVVGGTFSVLALEA